jgi:hypothetical protein
VVPGVIGVLANGKRFCNEGNGYHDYVAAMLAAVPPGQEVASWLVCTRRFQSRYGLGISRPTLDPAFGRGSTIYNRYQGDAATRRTRASRRSSPSHSLQSRWFPAASAPSRD